MRKVHVLAIGAIVLSGILFFLINIMTVHPGTTSGNGNPAILLMFPLVPLFFLIVYSFYRQSKRVKEQAFTPTLIVIVIYSIAGLFYQIHAFRNYKQLIFDENIRLHGVSQFGGEEGLKEYVDQITNGLSIHVNNQYFNVNTFILFIGAALFIAVVNRKLAGWNENSQSS